MANARPQVYHFEDENRMINACIAQIQECCDSAIFSTGSFRMALSGGKTPKFLYSRLAQSAFDWQSVKFYQTDERYLPATSSESNQKMIKSALENAIEAGAEFVSFNTNLSKEEAVKTYEQELETLECPIFDVVLLGVGRDGHVASLFPNQPELNKDLESLVLSSQNPDKQERLSLSLKGLKDTANIILYITGEDKYEVIDEILQGSKKPVDFPVKYLLDFPNVSVYYAEEAYQEQ
jgi:6-phosphogluconolactonase